MTDPRYERWAKVLVGYSVDVKPGDVVGISGGVAAEPLMRAINREVIRAGGKPVLAPVFDWQEADLLENGSAEQFQYVTPIEQFLRQDADVLIRVLAERNTRTAAEVDTEDRRIFEAAREPLRAVFRDRAAANEMRWSMTLFPTDGYAQDAGMSTEAFEDFVLSACKLDQEDPVAAWTTLHDEQQRLIDWLAGKGEVHVNGPGTDLRLSIAGRSWINSDGHRNFPSGEIFTGPIENSAYGHVSFSYPFVTAGHEIGGIRLEFRDGKVVDAHAEQDEEYLLSLLDTDEGARYLGEFAFGTNFGIQRFIKNMLFDEKIGGTVHMALGAGYPDTGSVNRSAIHSDMICDLRQSGEVTVDGVPFLRNGRYLI